MKNSVTLIRANAAVPFSASEQNLPPLSCEIKQGGILCFLGQRFRLVNLYLQMLAGLTQPHSGTLDYFIEPQTTPAHTHFPAIAYLSHHSNLLSVLSGIENVELPALYHQLGTPEQIKIQVKALLGELNYGADHTVLPSFMSMLQKRHLLMARALILNPKIVFIENPFADLELEEAAILGGYLAALVAEKNLTLVTSHANLDFVEHYARQIVYADQKHFHFFQDWQTFADYKQRRQLKF